MKTITKDQFVSVLNAAGITDAQKHQLHVAFETQYPDAHQRFLEFLGLSADQAAKIRASSRQG